MKRTGLAVAAAVAVALSSLPSLAQGPAGQRGMGRGPAWCAGPEGLGLSADQRRAMEKAEETYGDLLRTLRNQWTSKRLELQDSLADPKAGEEAIRGKARELAGAQAELQRTLLDYQLRVRAVLTPEQLGRWCGGAGRRRGGGWGAWPDP